MRLSKAPDLGRGAAFGWTCAGVTLIAAAALALSHGDIVTTLGDTDDAMRLVLVRQLAHGGGWYDQLVMRLQPPLGVYMHWSRLLDGALAGLIQLLGLALPAPAAEGAVRFFWPLALIAPAVISGLIIVRRLGGTAAVLVGAALMLANMELYGQFRPGRIDHHNVQIVMTLIAAACAIAGGRSVRAGVGAGLATGLGLAIGVEALPFFALIGASYGVAILRDVRQASASRAYAGSLLGATVILFAVQTPPWRWSLSVCDALGLNLVAAIVVGALGLAVVCSWTTQRSAPIRAAWLGLVAVVTLAVYLGLDPACWRGPVAAVDPRLRPIWFDGVQELLPWPRLLHEHPRDGLRSIATGLIALAAAAWLAIRSRRRGEGLGPEALVIALVVAGVAESALVYRAEDYSLWFGVPVLAVALTDLARRAWDGAMLPTVALALAASPVCVAVAAGLALPHGAAWSTGAGIIADHCLDNAAYGPLARLPPGLVLSEIDLGSFILADTPHSVLSAPYHRMSWGILSAHKALAATPPSAEPIVRGLGAAYVVVCPAHDAALAPASLGARLAQGATPPWLSEISTPGAALRVFRVAGRKVLIQRPHSRQAAQAAGVVHAVADQIAGRRLPGDEIGLDRPRGRPGLAGEHRGQHLRRARLQHQPLGLGH